MAERHLGRKTVLATGVATGVLAVLLAGITPTLAGFEMRAPAPSAPAVPSPTPPMLSAPAAAPSAVQSSGSVMWDENTSQMPTQKVPGIEASPLTQAEKGSLPPASSDMVSGFGSHMPLNMALQQVVPQQYKISLSPGVNGAKHVSWRGDRPWKMVLDDMLSSAHLSYEVQGNTVIVRHIGNGLPVARVASSQKADMIPDDMVAANAHEQFAQLPQHENELPPAASTSHGSAIHWDETGPATLYKAAPHQSMVPVPPAAPMAAKPAPLPPIREEAEVTPLPTPAHVLPPPAPRTPPVTAHHNVPLMQPSALPPPLATPVKIAAQPVATPASIEAPWHASKGETLKEVLRDWSQKAHVKLYWVTDYDYKLNSDQAYAGDFEDAVGKLFNQFTDVKPQPYGQLHRNPETGNVLVVNTYGTYN